MVETRVKDLEDEVKGLGREVSTLSGTVGSHIKQYSEDTERRDRVQAFQHKEVMGTLDTMGRELGEGIAVNTRKLRDYEVVSKALEKHGILSDTFQLGQDPEAGPAHPILQSKSRIAAAGAFGVGGVYVFLEMAKEFWMFVKGFKS